MGCAFDKPRFVSVYSLPGTHELLDGLLSFPDEKHEIFHKIYSNFTCKFRFFERLSIHFITSEFRGGTRE